MSAEVVDVRTLAPLDKETILDSVRKTGKAMVVYEDNRTYGAGAEIAATIAEEAMFDLDAPIVRDRRPRHPRDAVRRAARALLHRARARSPLPGDAGPRALLRSTRAGPAASRFSVPGWLRYPLRRAPT